MFRLSFDPAGEAKTRASYESGVSWHVIPSDILSAMDLTSHTHFLRRNGRHTDGLSLFTEKVQQYLLPSAKYFYEKCHFLLLSCHNMSIENESKI